MAGVHGCPRGVAPLRHHAASRDTPVAAHGRRNDPSASLCLMMRCLPAAPLFASWPWPRHHWILLARYYHDTYQRNRERARQEVYTRLKNQSLIVTKLLNT